MVHLVGWALIRLGPLLNSARMWVVPKRRISSLVQCAAVGVSNVACFHPWPAWRTSSGEVVFVERGDVVESLTLACGWCTGCRSERSRQWAVRVMHEASLYQRNCFLTLTYDDAHLPAGGSLHYPDFQRFMKRLRKRYGNGVRFYMCGEYGDKNDRPHFHAGIFGLDFHEDRTSWMLRRDYQIFRSPTLEILWPFGMSEIGELTFQSAAYMARYVLKKVNGDLADDHYARVDESTGEVRWLTPEFTHMSLKPGIGAGWYSKFHTDVFPHDRVVVNGVETKPPRYYDSLLRRSDPSMLEGIKEARVVQARERFADNTDERLKVRETVAKARLSLLKRSIK